MLPADFTLLQVTPALDAGGVETLTVDMAKAVAAAGAKSLVASRGGALAGELAAGGAELIPLPVHSRNPLSMALNVRRLERLINREKVSLVHVRSRAPAFSALPAAKRAGVAVVTTYHGIYEARSPLKRWYNSVMTRGEAVIANSAFTRGHILGQHPVSPDKVVVIPEGVDTSIFDPTAASQWRIAAARTAWGLDPADTRRIVLLPARLATWKGHKVIIAALARSAWRTRVVLVFAAGADQSDYARELVALAQAAEVDLRMPTDVTDMPAAYAAADLIVAPSTQAESFGRAVAEAGAMGRVVIASNLGGPAETIQDGQTGWLAPPGDIAAWTTAVDAALAMDDTAREAMGAAARERIVRLFSLERMCKATFALYLRIWLGQNP